MSGNVQDKTYTVKWSWPNDNEVMICKGLTARIAFARLIGALKNNGPITIHGIEKDG